MKKNARQRRMLASDSYCSCAASQEQKFYPDRDSGADDFEQAFDSLDESSISFLFHEEYTKFDGIEEDSMSETDVNEDDSMFSVTEIHYGDD